MGEAVGVIGGRGQSGGRGCWCDLAGGVSLVGEAVGMFWWERSVWWERLLV